MISKIPLGMHDPLRPGKLLGQTPSKSHTLGLSFHLNVPQIDLLSATGKMVLASLSKTGELPPVFEEQEKCSIQAKLIVEKKQRINKRDSIETHWVQQGESTRLPTSAESDVAQAKSFPQLPISLANLNLIPALGQVQILGQSSISTLRVLNLISDSSAEQKLEEFTHNLDTSQRLFPEISFSGLKSTHFQSEKSELTLTHQTSNQHTPTSWSSLAELVEDSPTPGDSLGIQDQDDREIEGFMFTPDGFLPIYANPREKASDVPDLIETETQRVSGVPKVSPGTNSLSVTLATPSSSKEPELVSESNLRILAQEVYKLVRQRWQIERERYRH